MRLLGRKWRPHFGGLLPMKGREGGSKVRASIDLEEGLLKAF
jgi:hypothetical protein